MSLFFFFFYQREFFEVSRSQGGRTGRCHRCARPMVTLSAWQTKAGRGGELKHMRKRRGAVAEEGQRFVEGRKRRSRVLDDHGQQRKERSCVLNQTITLFVCGTNARLVEQKWLFNSMSRVATKHREGLLG